MKHRMKNCALRLTVFLIILYILYQIKTDGIKSDDGNKIRCALCNNTINTEDDNLNEPDYPNKHLSNRKQIEYMIKSIPEGICGDHFSRKQKSYIYSHESIEWDEHECLNKFAFATLISGNEADYIHMARTLLYSYKRVMKLKVDFIALVIKQNGLTGRNRCLLEQVGWKIVEVNKLPHYKKIRFTDSRWYNTFTKIKVASLVKYDRILFVDADCLVLKNVDELYFLPADFAAVSNFGWNGSITSYINSGVFAVKPSLCFYYNLLINMNNTDEYGNFAEQDYLAWLLEFDIIRLPLTYNVNTHMLQVGIELYNRLNLSKRAKILHFTTSKPFKSNHEIVKLWADYYNNMSKEYHHTNCHD